MSNKKTNDLLNIWLEEYDDLKDALCHKGNEAHTVEYAILATQALKLSECIQGLQQTFIDSKQSDSQ